MLKEIVDETSFAKYDFMYLRIGILSSSLFSLHYLTDMVSLDFANNCK